MSIFRLAKQITFPVIALDTLISYGCYGLVLGLCHVAQVGEDDKTRKEAGEAVDAGGDLGQGVTDGRLDHGEPTSYHDVPVAVVVEFVVAGVSKVDPKACPSAVEDLNGSVYPHLFMRKFVLGLETHGYRDWAGRRVELHLGVCQPLPVHIQVVSANIGITFAGQAWQWLVGD